MVTTSGDIDTLKTRVNYQLPITELTRQALQRNEGTLNDTGALVISTGEFTGRSPADKFIVMDTVTKNTVNWNQLNQPITEQAFQQLQQEMLGYLDQKEEIWIREVYACADPGFRVSLRIMNEMPSSNHFVANMFLSPDEAGLACFKHDWLLIQAPGFRADPQKHGTRQGNFTIISFAHQTILIGGSAYTGEIKKSVFTILNFILPLKYGVLPMHCSANEGQNGDTTLFFGLSGTGKTTLSSDPERMLIGDDEHGWSDHGIFNFEGGCYAKVIHLSEEHEPAIFRAIRQGAIVENTMFRKNTREIDFQDLSITENTRVSYPLDFIPNAKSPSLSGVPRHIFFLTCDAYGVFPPVSRLTHEQALYYFINGYTARVAGTETGVKEPKAAFSACFGAPFLPLAPALYAGLLQEKLQAHGTHVWMINTGWTGGPYGTGKRISLPYTRAMIKAVLNGELAKVKTYPHPTFGVMVPASCPGVPTMILNPEETWENPQQYNAAAVHLANLFDENFKRITI